MRANEKLLMVNTYKDQFNHYLVSNGSDFERLQLDGMKAMLKLFFSDMEINAIENSVRVTSKYQISLFESIESWLRQIEKEQGIKAVPFTRIYSESKEPVKGSFFLCLITLKLI